jgi:predicted transport protein
MPRIKTTIKLTDNLLEKIKGKELVQCYFTPEGNVELEFSDVSQKCEEFAKELDMRDKEIDEGKGIILDVDNIGKRYGL